MPPWAGLPLLPTGIGAPQPPGSLAQAASHPSALLSHPRLPDYFNEDNDSHLGNSNPLTITILISFHYKSETSSLTFKTLAIGNSVQSKAWVGWGKLWEGWARLRGAGGIGDPLAGGEAGHLHPMAPSCSTLLCQPVAGAGGRELHRLGAWVTAGRDRCPELGGTFAAGGGT